MKKIYTLKTKDELIFTGEQIKEFKKKVIEFKKKVIEDYKKSEYFNTLHQRARRKGFVEAVDGLKQWIINEENLDPEPCCNGVRIVNIISKLEEWKQQGDKRFVLDQKHIDLIKVRLKQGESKNSIAKELGVSISTIVYWTNPVFRRRQREKNAKRRYGKKLIAVDELNEEVKDDRGF